MHVTVLICTHNRQELLKRVIDSLNLAIHPENCKLDLLIVANACTDHTLAWLKRYGDENRQLLPLSFLSEPLPGKSHALNKALQCLDCDLVALIDDDHRVDEHFFEKIVSTAADHPSISIFCGRILPDWDGREPDWVHDNGSYKIYPPPIPVYDQGTAKKLIDSNSDQPGGGNLFIRLDILKRNGPFSTSLGPRGHNFTGGEDSEFLLRARKSGEQVLYTPDIIQYHYVDHDRLKLKNLMRLAYQRSRCITAMTKTDPNRSAIPLYMWRKLASYLSRAFFAFNANKFRFYLVRTAATVGEIMGLITRLQ